MSSSTLSPWHSLPTEMKLTVLDSLDSHDVRRLATVDHQTYALCVPNNFKSVKLSSCHALSSFLKYVPKPYHRYIYELDVSTMSSVGDHATPSDDAHPRTNNLASLLMATPRLEKLSMQLAGSLANNIIPCFPLLHNLKQLSISNWGSEEDMPISERLVVSIAASIPSLEDLSLNRITRSSLHAPELLGIHPYVPLVTGDHDISDHPTLGTDLSLPSLLRIPTLRKLAIRDTHLGDPRWATTPVACRLEILDLGSCYHETDNFNAVCTERIMATVGTTVDEFSLTTPVSDELFTKPHITPLPRLRKLHITPLLPVENVVDAISTLAGSPIESLSLQCYEEDAADMCTAVEEFLNLRVERGPDFYNSLTRIDVAVTAFDEHSAPQGTNPARERATRRLQEYCRDLRLSSVVTEVRDGALAHGKPVANTSDAKKWSEVGGCGKMGC